MKLCIENVGAIKKAEIDLGKNLTILTGANNSGKTYITNILYGLYNIPLNTNENFEIIKIINFDVVDNPELKVKNALLKFNSYDIFINNENKIMEAIGTITKKNLPKIFGTNDEYFLDSKITFKVNHKEKVKDIIYQQKFKGYNSSIESKFSTIEFDKSEESFDVLFRLTDYNYSFEDGLKEYHIIQIQNILLQSFLYAIINGGDKKEAIIYPSERIAIDIFQKEIKNGGNSLLYDDAYHVLMHVGRGIIPSRPNNNIKEENKNRGISLAIKDFANIISTIPSRNNIKSEYSILGEELEEIIIGGKIEMENDGSINLKSNNEKYLDLNLTSSLVKSLSSLVFYFKYIAKKNDVIIIDEPELNLHPNLQIKFSRFIGKLVHENFKVIISTHSDYIIREINTLIMLGNRGGDSIDLIRKYEYSFDSVLKFNDVSVYYLHNHIVEEIEVSESGFDVETIDNVILEQNSRAEDIYFSLF